MKVLTVLFFLAISAQAFAKNRVELMLESKNGNSPFEILKEFHESEGRRAELGELNFYDLDKDSSSVSFKCAYAHSYYSAPANTDFYIFKKNKIIPGIPASGPLFPGTPEKKIPRSGISLDFQQINYPSSIDSLLDATTVTSTDQELVFKLNYVAYTNFISVRKHGDMLSFYAAQKDEGNAIQYERYGYCWIE